MSLQTAEQLWSSNSHLAEKCLDHPFVQGIASGKLSRVSFKFYVGQDAFFLESFARAYALALAKSTSSSLMYDLLEQLQGALEELNLHQNYARKWGVELSPQPAGATQGYTDFLLRVAWSEPVECIIAALMPCMRLYSYLGQSLLPVLNPESDYREWVETYSSSDFEQLAAKLERLYNQQEKSNHTGKRAELYYKKAMELELAFFQQAFEYAAD